MSLLWRNHLRISLCPDRLVLGSYSRGLRPSRARNETIAVQPLANAEEWRAAVDALPKVLAAHPHHDFSVVVADQFVRYALLPFNEALKSSDQWATLARHRLTAVHGAAAAEWDLKLTETAPMGARIACAVDRALIEELSALFVAANARLVSVQPFLVAAFNRIRSTVGNGSCWLVIEEPGRSTLAYIQRGAWHAIRSRGTDGREPAPIAEMLERETAILGLDKPVTQVFMHSDIGADASTWGRYEVRDVTLASGAAVRDRKLAMAIG